MKVEMLLHDLQRGRRLGEYLEVGVAETGEILSSRNIRLVKGVVNDEEEVGVLGG